jgi:DNA-binding transcriptional LysR family regulator
MELRHLRYFIVVAQELSFTRASAKLRIAQPALSRQVQDLEDEIGVDLLQRGPRGVALTAEGRLYLAEAQQLLKSSDEAIGKVRALARGEYGELHVGYSPSAATGILPTALTEFQKSIPGVKVTLHDLAGDELTAGLLNGSLQLAVMVERADADALGLHYEELQRYRFCIAMAPDNPLARKRQVSVAQAAAEPLVAFRRSEYSGYHKLLDKVFSPHGVSPRVAVECDSAGSLVTEVEVGHGIALVSEVFREFSGKRLAYRQLSDSTESHTVGIGRSIKGDVTPAGEKFCAALRRAAGRQARTQRTKPSAG